MQSDDHLFEKWSELKQSINGGTFDHLVFPKSGEVWLSTLGKNIGFEQNGSGDRFVRPVLIIKKINNKMCISIPLSSIQKNLDFYFNYRDPLGNNVSAIISQIRLISTKRLIRKLYCLDSYNYRELKQKLINYIQS